ncbi:membrane dipeptidase [Gluconobacter cerinus]|uniref:Peptidase M19 n=1 Tax=Gluconobacter cerinus TaxID=38307 RepID=A0AAV5NHY2_9PROT|nr:MULTISPECIES: membrane dipeptidase [Gluconobacter]MBS1026446.1 membrane dipeptidase [Gluconobacter cerinus]MBS1032556.1 membrane dipeptidase [Gluconobacter cerinus]MBS1039033.1 membrane dipeptidase [Gluconobacter cerinus]MBS1045520.1 membrane dipeptidase [Gluconobacter cerinus]OUJ08223.1 peptidase M19 [Gluconobacter sp. DsW_058]
MTEDSFQLHQRSIVIDGLQTCAWSREIFEQMRAGGLTVVNAASLLWENFSEGMAYVRTWERHFAENADLIIPIRSVADIETAKRTNRTGISIGWQNTSPLEDRLDYVRLFKLLGVNTMQLTYNTQNYSGAGYLEERDSGLTGFGREVLHEMNRHGVLCDLSHVGDLTSADVIEHSRRPVCISHVLPRALRDVKRNKPDHLFRACAEKGGIVGVSLFSPGLRAGNDATIDDYLDAMTHVLNIVGEDHIAMGTDFSTGHPRPGPWLLWANRDKGYGRQLTEFGRTTIRKPAGFASIPETPNLTAAMMRRGWSTGLIEKILGQNWLRLYRDTWTPEV